ncbi:DNA polymerase III subunit delta' [Streptococcus cameli]
MIEEKIRNWQPQLHTRFEGVLADQALAHAYLFSGSFGSFEMAIWLSQSLFCTEKTAGKPCGTCRNCRLIANQEYTDVTIVRPQGNLIKTDTVRELIKNFSQSGFESDKQVFIICDAEKMHVNAANSLLKVIEEPQSDIVLFLLTNQEEAVLPTIKSRTQIVPFPANKAIFQEELEQEGVLKTEARLLSDLMADKEEALLFLKNKHFRDSLSFVPKFIQAWEKDQMEAYLMVGQLTALATDKVEQEQLLNLLTVSVSRDWTQWKTRQMVEDLLTVRQMWQSNVSLQNALEYVLLRK